MRPLHGTVFSTGFDVVDKDLSRVKTVAETALHRQRVLKYALHDLKTTKLLRELVVPILY